MSDEESSSKDFVEGTSVNYRQWAKKCASDNVLEYYKIMGYSSPVARVELIRMVADADGFFAVLSDGIGANVNRFITVTYSRHRRVTTVFGYTLNGSTVKNHDLLADERV